MRHGFLSFLTLVFSIFWLTVVPQTRKITLQEAILTAKRQSPDALNARHQFRASYWEFKTFRRQSLPMLSVNATVPDFERAINKYTLPDGSETFIRQSYANYIANMSIMQQIGVTGGSVFVRSGLQRLDNFADSTATSYLSTPINIGYVQPIFQFNPYRWDKKIEPLKYDQSKRIYLESVEQVCIQTVNYFFDLLQAQIEKDIANTNMANYDTLFKIAKGRFQLGKIAENDLLLLELNFLKAQTAVENADLDLENKLFRFKSYLRIKDTVSIELIPPTNIDFITINPQEAIGHAFINSSLSLDFDRRLLEAARDVNRAKLENRFDAELQAVFGLTQSAPDIPEVYRNPLDQEQISLGISIPILDWGLAKGRIKMAQSKEEIVKTSVEQDIIDFRQNIYLKVVQFNIQKNQLMIAAKADTVAQKTYDVTKARYLIGKINSILDLNNAQIEGDNARKSFFFTLQTYWRSYYEIRKMCLFDFYKKEKLTFDFKEIL